MAVVFDRALETAARLHHLRECFALGNRVLEDARALRRQETKTTKISAADCIRRFSGKGRRHE
jgi:hypothetical protein